MNSATKSTLYKNLCIVLGIAVLILGYYAFFAPTATQWTACISRVPSVTGYTPPTPRSTQSEATTTKESTPMPSIPMPRTGSLAVSSDEWLTLSGSSPTTSTWAIESTDLVYLNESIGYSFSMPRNSYFAGFGAQDGADHTVGIKTGTGAESFSGADVRVWYYPRTHLADLSKSESGFYQDPSINMTYLMLGSGSVRIEGDMESPIVNKIIATIKHLR